MPLTRDGIELRDAYFYNSMEAYGTVSTEDSLDSAVLTPLGILENFTSEWTGAENLNKLEYYVSTTITLNMVVFKIDSTIVAYAPLAITQTLTPGTRIFIDGRTFSN